MSHVLIKPFHYIKITDPLPMEVASAAEWVPFLRVVVTHGQKSTPSFLACADSGSSLSIFRAGMGRMLNIPFERTPPQIAYGVDARMTEPIHFFPIELSIENRWRFRIQAGFMENLAVPGILGTAGFFEHFRVCFDHGSSPPTIHISPAQS